MSATTPIPVPTLDQQVQYMSGLASATPLTAAIVHIHQDGPVDIVVTDASLPEEFKVTRIPYAPYGSTNTPTEAGDPRYVYQIGHP